MLVWYLRSERASPGPSTPDGIEAHQRWAINIARKHRAIVNRITNHYRSAFESESVGKDYGGEPDNSSAVAREVAKNLEYYLYDLREEMGRLGLVVPELPKGMKVTKRPEENISYDEDGNVTGRWTQHGPPSF